jgi:hypothetical protein
MCDQATIRAAYYAAKEAYEGIEVVEHELDVGWIADEYAGNPKMQESEKQSLYSSLLKFQADFWAACAEYQSLGYTFPEAPAGLEAPAALPEYDDAATPTPSPMPSPTPASALTPLP